MNALKQKCLLDELSKHIVRANIHSYRAYWLTKKIVVWKFLLIKINFLLS